MDKQGYERMLSAARSVDASAWAEWGPQEKVRYVGLRPSGRVEPATILNALGEAGLMAVRDEEAPANRSQPCLVVIGQGADSITFEDLNYEPTTHNRK